MCRFIESIKVLDGVFYRLEYHQTRVQLTCDKFFPDSEIIELSKAFKNLEIPQKGVFKCRVLYSSEIQLIEFVPYTRRDIKTLKLVDTDIDSSPYKFENRSLYNAAFAKRENCDDVLLMKNGLLTDTSYCNIALFNGSEWFTPRVPLLYGTNRAQLLSETVLIEKDIKLDEIFDYQQIALFNAMIEFGELVLDIKQIETCPPNPLKGA
jgi:4-amino-4-deoxychorismate lyase